MLAPAEDVSDKDGELVPTDLPAAAYTLRSTDPASTASRFTRDRLDAIASTGIARLTADDVGVVALFHRIVLEPETLEAAAALVAQLASVGTAGPYRGM